MLDTPLGDFVADFLITGTGVRMNAHLCPELQHCADNIAIWADRYTPPAEERNERLAEYPYLNADSAFEERRPGETPWIRDIHLFGIGTTMSFGPAGASINAMTISAPRVAAGVTRGLFAADMPRLYADLRAYNVVQVEIDPSTIASAPAAAAE